MIEYHGLSLTNPIIHA